MEEFGLAVGACRPRPPTHNSFRASPSARVSITRFSSWLTSCSCPKAQPRDPNRKPLGARAALPRCRLTRRLSAPPLAGALARSPVVGAVGGASRLRFDESIGNEKRTRLFGCQACGSCCFRQQHEPHGLLKFVPAAAENRRGPA
jgi:hypothetical protein